MARRERSAGIILFHQPRANAPREYLLLDYGKHWDYAKGHVDENESDLEAALRELAEETGITSVELVPGFLREIVYFYRHPRRGLIRKEVIFFLGRAESKEVALSHEHVGHEFLPFEDAVKRVTYATARQLLRDAHEHLQRHGSG
jgi:8-oxo-dGTP pyrophosphatase MutT (NUDIX family)